MEGEGPVGGSPSTTIEETSKVDTQPQGVCMCRSNFDMIL